MTIRLSHSLLNSLFRSRKQSAVAMSDSEDQTKDNVETIYEDRPAVRNAFVIGAQGAAVGTLVASVQNALQSHNRGAFGILTRSGGTIGFFGNVFVCFVSVQVC